MKTIPVYSLGALPSFTLSPADDGYWTERLSYELSSMLRDANVQGMELSQPEESDFDTYQTQIDGYLTQFKAWVNRAYDRSNSRLLVQDLVEVVPPVIQAGGTVAAAALSGGGSLLVPVLINAGIQLLSHVVAGQANNLVAPRSQDVSDIAEAIREAFRRDRNQDSPVSVFMSETDLSGGSTIKLSVSDVVYKSLLMDTGEGFQSLLAMALSNFHVRVYQEDGRNWLEFGLVENEARPGL